MLRMMEEVGRITGVQDQDIWIYLCNLAPTDMVEYGHVLPKPGEEATWYDGLPKALQNYLQSLGTTMKTSRYETAALKACQAHGDG